MFCCYSISYRYIILLAICSYICKVNYINRKFTCFQILNHLTSLCLWKTEAKLNRLLHEPTPFVFKYYIYTIHVRTGCARRLTQCLLESLEINHNRISIAAAQEIDTSRNNVDVVYSSRKFDTLNGDAIEMLFVNYIPMTSHN